MYFCSFVELEHAATPCVNVEPLCRSELLYSIRAGEFIASREEGYLIVQKSRTVPEVYKLIRQEDTARFFRCFVTYRCGAPGCRTSAVSYDVFIDGDRFDEALINETSMPCEKIFLKLLHRRRHLMYFDRTHLPSLPPLLWERVRRSTSEDVVVRRNRVRLNDEGWQRTCRLNDSDNDRLNRLLAVKASTVHAVKLLPLGSHHVYNLSRSLLYRTDENMPSVRFTQGCRARGGLLVGGGGGRVTSVVAAVSLSRTMPTPNASSLVRSFYVPSRATLIVVPNHLVGFWVEKVRQTNGALRIVQLRQHKDFKKQTIGDASGADIVICSENMFVTYTLKHDSRWDSAAWTMQRVALEQDETHESNPISNNSLTYFNWRRIVFDQYQRLSHLLTESTARSMQAQYGVWFLSAVDTVPSPSLRNIMMAFMTYDDDPLGIDPSGVGMVGMVDSTAVTRTGLASFLTTRHVVPLTPDEWERYSALEDVCRAHENETVLQQLSGFGSAQGGQYIKLIERFHDVDKYIQHRYATRLSHTGDEDTDTLRRRQQHFSQKIAILHANRNQGQQLETCSICYSNSVSCIVMCGHCFCWRCLFKSLKRSKSCPLCRCTIYSGDAVEFRTDRFKTRRERFLAAVQTFQAADQRVVIVCQHRVPLQQCRKHLLDRGIMCRRLYGSVRTMQLSYEKFQARKINVLLLPLSNLHGLTLDSVDHVMFVYAPLNDGVIVDVRRLNENSNMINLHYFESSFNDATTVESEQWRKLFA